MKTLRSLPILLPFQNTASMDAAEPRKPALNKLNFTKDHSQSYKLQAESLKIRLVDCQSVMTAQRLEISVLKRALVAIQGSQLQDSNQHLNVTESINTHQQTDFSFYVKEDLIITVKKNDAMDGDNNALEVNDMSSISDAEGKGMTNNVDQKDDLIEDCALDVMEKSYPNSDDELNEHGSDTTEVPQWITSNSKTDNASEIMPTRDELIEQRDQLEIELLNRYERLRNVEDYYQKELERRDDALVRLQDIMK